MDGIARAARRSSRIPMHSKFFAMAWTQEALDAGISAKTIIDDGLIPGMD